MDSVKSQLPRQKFKKTILIPDWIPEQRSTDLKKFTNFPEFIEASYKFYPSSSYWRLRYLFWGLDFNIDFNPNWATKSVVELAHQITNENKSAGPYLADALEDAGCDNEMWLRILREYTQVVFPGMPFIQKCKSLDSSLRQVGN